MKSTEKYLRIDKQKDKVILMLMSTEVVDGKPVIQTNFHMLNSSILDLAFMLNRLEEKVNERISMRMEVKDEPKTTSA